MMAIAGPVATVETARYSFARFGGGVVRFTAKAVDYDLPEALEATALLREASQDQGARLRLLVDMRALRSFSRAARVQLQDDAQARYVVGTALLVDSGVSRVVGNFIIGLNRGEIPTRLFTCEHEALAWLESLEDSAG